MLKSTDLMIGDFVRQKHSGIILKVSKIDPPYIEADGEGGRFHEEAIEPIPTAEEMLKTNGWKSKHHTSWLFFRDGCDELNILFCCGCTQIEYLNMIYNPEDNAEVNYGSSFEFPRTVFVHELQHIIRMYEMEKEIKP